MSHPDPTRILFANPGADLFGSDRMMLESVRGLARAGFKVLATVPADGPLVPELQEAGAEVVIQPTPILRKGLLSVRGMLTLTGQTLAAIPGNWRLLRSSRAATLVVNTITPPLWLLLGRLAPGVRVACHVHEAEQALPRWLRRGLYLPMYAADRVIANSRHSLHVLAESAPKLSGRTVVVHNAVPGPAHPPPPRAELDGAVRLLYLGRISERKGLLVAVEALARLVARGQATTLRIVGSVFAGNEAFLAELRQRIAELGLTELVDFAGFQSLVWPELADADIVLVPSLLDESFGNVAVEAALGARPAVVSALAGLREATEFSGALQLVEPGDPEAIEEAVIHLVEHWAEVCANAVAAAPVVAETYSSARFTADLMAALGLVGRNPEHG